MSSHWLRCVAQVGLLLVVWGCPPRDGGRSTLPSDPLIDQARRADADGRTRDAIAHYHEAIRLGTKPVLREVAQLELGALYVRNNDCQSAAQPLLDASRSDNKVVRRRVRIAQLTCAERNGAHDAVLEAATQLLSEPLTSQERLDVGHAVLGAAATTTNAPLALRALDAALSAEPDPSFVPDMTELASAHWSTLDPETFDHVLRMTRRGGPTWTLGMELALERALQERDAARSATLLTTVQEVKVDPASKLGALVGRAEFWLQGNPAAVGILLPLSGRGREVGERILKGIRTAADAVGGPELIVLDSAGSAEAVEKQTAQLVEEDNVVAILGPVRASATAHAAAVSRATGVPLLTFSSDPTSADLGDHVFRTAFSPQEELHALIRMARAHRVSRFGILFPDNGYGQAMHTSFVAEVSAQGGVLCDAVSYPPGHRSVSEQVSRLIGAGCEAVLLADSWSQIPSIAPTFALEGAWPTPIGEPSRVQDTVPIVLMLPSVGWNPKLVASTGRYLQGALVPQAYSSRPTNAFALDFRNAFQEAYGEDPDFLAALGFDAYHQIVRALGAGARTRRDVREQLLKPSSSSSVGAAAGFSAQRTPNGLPPIFELRQDELQPMSQ